MGRISLFILCGFILISILCYGHGSNSRPHEKNNMFASQKQKTLNYLKRLLQKRSIEATIGEFPWHVFIPLLRCSGVLIHGRFVITSTSCLSRSPSKLPPSALLVRVGNHHINLEAPGEDTIPVLYVLTFPNYDNKASAPSIAVLYLAREVIKARILRRSSDQLLNLPRGHGSLLKLGLKAKVMGWGHHSRTASPLSTLHYDSVTISDLQLCNTNSSYKRRPLNSDLLCLQNASSSLCSVDDGSPVIAQDKDGSYILLGVFAWGKTCEVLPKPTIFTQINPPMIRWLKELFRVKDQPHCNSSRLKVLNDERRDVTNKTGGLSSPLCDSELLEDWYQLQLGGLPAVMPTSCPDSGTCGTTAQIWLTPNTVPSFAQRKNGTACVSWSGNGKRVCCLWQIPISVVHCGDFFAYHLKRIKECPAAYCTKAVRTRCGPNKVGYVPKCKVRGRYPTFSEAPTIKPGVPPDSPLAASSISLTCSYGVRDPGDFLVGFMVTWYKNMKFLGGSDGKQILFTQNTVKTSVTINSGHIDFGLGDTVTCTVKSYFSDQPQFVSSPKTSRKFYVGVKIEPPYLAVTEDQSEWDITFSLTVPLVCPPETTNCSMQISVLTLPVATGPAAALSDIALAKCKVEFTPQACSDSDCGRQVVKLIAIADFTQDGDRSTRIITIPIEHAPAVWTGYDPPDIFVQVRDLPTNRCYSFMGSYLRTLDGRYFVLPEEGEFTLYSSLTRVFEVQSRTWPCGHSRHKTICNCGVAVRENNDVIVMDMCDGTFKRTSLQVSIRSRLPLAKGTEITEANNGKRFTVYFPSGAHVRADAYDWGINIYIQSPARDNADPMLRGLCVGSLMHTTDSANVNGGSIVPEEIVDLPKELRLKSKDSLFAFVPAPSVPPVSDQFEDRFCYCAFTETMFLGSNHSRTCKKIKRPTLTKETSVTQRIIDIQNSHKREPQNIVSAQLNSVPGRGRENKNPTLSLLDIINHCRKTLTDTPLAQICKKIVKKRYMEILTSVCIRDVEMTSEPGLAEGAVGILESICEEEAIKNLSLWQVSGTGQSSPPMRVRRVMCPNQCSQHGSCKDQNCTCRRGYTGEDCSVSTNMPPELLAVRHEGLCDLNKYDCRQAQLVGKGFLNSLALKCSFRLVKFRGTQWTSNLTEKHTVEGLATFETYRGVSCAVPEQLRNYTADQTTLRGYLIQVSNDGRLWTKSMTFVAYDSTCLHCLPENRSCSIKVGKMKKTTGERFRKKYKSLMIRNK